MGKKNLVLEYLRNEEIEKEKQKLADEYNLEKESIIIPKQKVSKVKVFLNFLTTFSAKIFRIIFYLIIFLLVTVRSNCYYE